MLAGAMATAGVLAVVHVARLASATLAHDYEPKGDSAWSLRLGFVDLPHAICMHAHLVGLPGGRQANYAAANSRLLDALMASGRDMGQAD